jgi:hypothetical protein
MIQRIVREGELMPRFYGIAWRNYFRREAVCFPVPLNVILAFARQAYLWIRLGHVEVSSDPRSAYEQGRREAQQSGRRYNDRQFTGAGVVHLLFCGCFLIAGLVIGAAL